MNFWTVLILFCVIGLATGRADVMPKSFQEFIGNALFYNLSYNGAWWYVTTYIFLLLLQSVMFKIVRKSTVITAAGIVVSYIIGCGFRFYGLCPVTNIVIIDWILRQFGLLMYAMSGYMIGMYFAKARTISKIKEIQDKKISKNVRIPIYLAVTLILIVIHGFIQSVVFAIITAVSFICIFNIWQKGNVSRKIFSFLGKHSTNVWLTHMFFYADGMIFSGLVFKAKYPILVFLFMMMLCVGMSFILKLMEKMYENKNNNLS